MKVVLYVCLSINQLKVHRTELQDKIQNFGDVFTQEAVQYWEYCITYYYLGLLSYKYKF